jgi:hypothetical protein
MSKVEEYSDKPDGGPPGNGPPNIKDPAIGCLRCRCLAFQGADDGPDSLCTRPTNYPNVCGHPKSVHRD